MNASQFDGNAAFSGGGFTVSQATTSGDSPFTPSKNRDAQALLPLTIKQINDAYQASDDKTNLTIDGVDVGTISLLGRVCNKAGQITDVKFVLDDGTGMIECTKWLQEPADSIQVESILNGMYVRVYGHLKGFQGKKNLNVFSFRPVTDFNEITHHFIDCIYVHLYNSKLRASNSNQQHVPNSTQITPTRGHQSQAVLANQFSANNGQKTVEDLVLEILHHPTNRTKMGGTPLDVIRQHLGIPMDKLMLAITNLANEGTIYEGEQNHYKSIADG
ncbi:replication protein A 32 kDa subunit B [Vicia villosa]|uniref:replication protein A 32 kDa subunit B n=1 Tax=Vicia villosa TaxID=3911 RepID=UPI00273C5B78|nr:replication protein A 32 kDa subunit B [Vicia villosa]